MRFRPNIDGYMLPRLPAATFALGQQSRVPLLAGWNADEIRAGIVLGPDKPTAEGFAEQLRARFGDAAPTLLALYPATTDAQALDSAAALAGDLFLGHATWKWLEMQGQTGASPVFRYSFDRKIPVPRDHKVNGVPATSEDVGARHAGEIEYVFGAFASQPSVPWQDQDRRLSDLMMSYWTNFARAGDPNGPGLPRWPIYEQASGYQVLHLDDGATAAPDRLRGRYELLDALATKQAGH